MDPSNPQQPQLPPQNFGDTPLPPPPQPPTSQPQYQPPQSQVPQQQYQPQAYPQPAAPIQQEFPGYAQAPQPQPPTAYQQPAPQETRPAPTRMTAREGLEHLSEGEFIVETVKKHPFGIVIIYVLAAIGLGAGYLTILFFLPTIAQVLGKDKDAVYGMAMVFLFFATVLAVIILALATYVYKASRLIITNINVTQIYQNSLFNRKVSELSLSNVEDVTAAQKGIFAKIFNYGLLTVETAGEQANFSFTYCPHAGRYAQIISDARSQYMNHRREH